MKIFPKSCDIREYLKADAVIDYNDESVSSLADELYKQSEDNLDYIRNAYEYVRDRIPHSADVNAEEVACSASEVLSVENRTRYLLCKVSFICRASEV